MYNVLNCAGEIVEAKNSNREGVIRYKCPNKECSALLTLRNGKKM